MIIDSHVHISCLKKEGEISQVKDELLLNMKRNEIDYSIIIPDNVSNSRCADLETIAAIIKNEPKLHAVGTIKITEINKINLARMDKLFQKRVIRVFKIFPGHELFYPTDKRWHPVYKLCIKYDFPLIIHTGINSDNRKCARYNDPKHIIKIAEMFPKLKIIIAHYFWPKLDYCFSITNGINNIYFDTSALADSEVIKTSGGIKKIKEILIKTIKRRINSVIFGTDWPMGNVKKHLDLINSLGLKKEEKNALLFKNSLKLFKL